jgi:hypothetical protein
MLRGNCLWRLFFRHSGQPEAGEINGFEQGTDFQREIVDRAILSLKDAGVPSFLIE